MPCNGDYMEPNGKEKRLQETAQLLIFVLGQLNEAVPEIVRIGAKNIYCSFDFVSILCDRIGGMTSEELDAIVYNGHDRTSRQLADWWEEHKQADVIRTAQETYTTEIIKRWVNVTGTAWPTAHNQQRINCKHIMDFANSLLDNPPVKL